MDQDQTLDHDFSTELNLDGEIRSYLQETAKWAYFMAIVGFVMMGLLVLIGLFMGTILGTLPGGEEMPFPPALFSFIYFLIALIYLFPILYLYRFASNMKAALQSSDQLSLVTAFLNLKSHYKFIGIFLAIILGFYAIGILMALLGGGLALLGM